MKAVEQSIYQEITEKLKTAPKDILERVLGYLDGVLEREQHSNFELTEEQKNSLGEIKKRPYSEHTDISLFLNEMDEKYGV